MIHLKSEVVRSLTWTIFFLVLFGFPRSRIKCASLIDDVAVTLDRLTRRKTQQTDFPVAVHLFRYTSLKP